MRVTNKRRFTAFIIALMILSGIGGFYVGISFASEEAGTPVIIEESEPVEEPEGVATIEFVDIGTYTITAYCGCEICCGEWSSNPAVGFGGVELIEGVHCASPLPLGTIVDIEGLGLYEVQDRTADWVVEKYGEKIIDIYFENHDDAKNFKMTANVKKVVEVK